MMDAAGKDYPEAKSYKLGLGLSGGGFRASFFHLGVMAQMAQLGLLRQVEVISTVSGGSIIGALYYLHVKCLLEYKPDQEISDRDYISIIKTMERDFTRAVQCNLRMLTFADFEKNLRMFRPNYSRSDRIGELYDELIYQGVIDPGRPGMIRMRDLKIFPQQADGSRDEEFNPATGNAAREAKVPILLLNATTLNTGHNWRFEAVRMGEPPQETQGELDIDQNARLERRGSYDEISPGQQDIELGLAVAASACVPGVFHPLAVSELYLGWRLQLVDGGVYDNQGIQGLLDMGCEHLVISDGSKQMADEPDPSTGLAAVLARTNSILMARTREEQLLGILEDQGRRVAFIHLRKELAAPTVPIIGSDGKAAGTPPAADAGLLTSFGVAREVQDLLAKVRTDLDSFTDVESSSLMLDGFLISQRVLATTDGIQERLALPPAREDWGFNEIREFMEKPTRDYLRQLKVAGKSALKVFFLDKALGLAALGTLLLLALWLLPKLICNKQVLVTLTVGKVAWAALLGLAVWTYPRLKRWLNQWGLLTTPARVRLSYIVSGVLAVLAWGLVKIHLKIFDPWFLRRGKVSNLQRPVGSSQ